jgi:hypothetical protein
MAYTTIPVAGAKLRASVLSSLVTEVRPLSARKTIDETVNNSATMQNDDELFVAVAANSVYELNLRIQYNSNATADFKYGFTFPAGTTMQYTQTVYGVGIAVLNTFEQDQTSTPGIEGQAAIKGILITGVVITSSTAGTLQLQWAQNTANVSNTLLKAGSHMRLQKLS